MIPLQLSGDGFDGCWGTYPFLPSGLILSLQILIVEIIIMVDY